MIGERIKQLRENNNCSQAELAKQIGISQSSLGNYERGDRMPDAQTIVSLTQRFNVSSDYLLGLTDDPSPSPAAVDNLGLSEASISELLRIKDLGLASFLNYFISICEKSTFHEFLYTLQRIYNVNNNRKYVRFPELETDEFLKNIESGNPDYANFSASVEASKIEKLAKAKLGVDARLVIENDLIDYLRFRAHIFLDYAIEDIERDASSKQNQRGDC